jgi:DNA-binding LytR/AlgR family response regulator
MSDSETLTSFVKIKAVAVEDNIQSLKKLKSLLENFDHIEVIGEARNGRTAIDVINTKKPDLIFLDIQLPEIDGFEVLKGIRHHPYVIFTTAHDQYAIKAFEANAVDYILKPIGKDRLKIAVERVVKLNKRLDSSMMEVVEYIKRQKNRKIRFSIKKDDCILIIPQDDVYYFKSEERYVFLCTYNRRYFYNSSIKELSESLDPDIFCRINRSYIVALDKIVKLKKNYLREYKVILNDQNNTALKVSRNHLAALKDKLNIL